MDGSEHKGSSPMSGGRKGKSGSGMTPLLQPERSPATKRKTTSVPTFAWILVGALVLLGTINFVFLSTVYKAYTDKYAFFVNQGINFMYVVMGGCVLYPKQLFTKEIDSSLNFPQRKFIFMGFLDSLGTLFTALGAVHTPSVFQPLLNQTLIPFTIVASYLFLGSRFHRLALLGAFGIVTGASLTIFSCVFGTCDRGSNVSVKWYSILIYFLSNVPMALSAVYKEVAFKDVHVNVWYLCQWVSIYQFFLTFLYLPLTVLPSFGGDGWTNLWPRFYDGFKCTFGYGDCVDAFALPFPCEEKKGVFWLLLGYCVVNFTFNYVGLLLTKCGSATLRSISYAVILPATSLAFCLPMMGELQEKLTPFIPVAIVVVLISFFMYQRYASIETDLELNDDDDGLAESNSSDADVVGGATKTAPHQVAFCERTGGLDIVNQFSRRRREGNGRERACSTPQVPFGYVSPRPEVDVKSASV